MSRDSWGLWHHIWYSGKIYTKSQTNTIKYLAPIRHPTAAQPDRRGCYEVAASPAPESPNMQHHHYVQDMCSNAEDPFSIVLDSVKRLSKNAVLQQSLQSKCFWRLQKHIVCH
ncbi:hypothetical protein Y1Q_0001090 [Alligator mississippiensis]|uniref:Uncharacterized protein n=1 Tax=Alligator mississippiensis TaxID=8496 RepID=A0A151NEY4_ALLMI|nr:hypothetical protein Y1Q_0001090 [Alligator mississippiensis]